jgi:hypothetical protein
VRDVVAQQQPPQPIPFTITAAGQSSPIVNAIGLGNCGVQLDNTGGGVTLVPQATSDQNPSLSSPWATASNINSGSISTAGTYSGLISDATTAGLTGFKVIATSVTSGTITGKIVCTNAQTNVTAVLSGGTVTVRVSSTPFPVTTPVPCVTNGAGTACNVAGVGTAGTFPVVLTDSAGTNQGVVDVNGNQSISINQATRQAQVGASKNGAVGTNVLFVSPARNSGGMNPLSQCDQQTAVNISTATTTSIVAVSGSTVPVICAYHLYVVSGTLPTFVFEHGTGAACTGAVADSGTFGGVAAAVGESFEAGSGVGPLLTGAASSGFCILSGGTTPNIQGWVSWTRF